MAPIPITIVTGFLGSGKTTLILNLVHQLPKDYKLALLKNEFGDLAIDTQLAATTPIAGVQELLNGCICCNLVGQLGPALEQLRREVEGLDRIVIETSGSAFPATLALEINRIAREGGVGEGEGEGGEKKSNNNNNNTEDDGKEENYILDGVISVLDVENWPGYEDTSYTAKMQAKFTDLIVLNKWERAGERRVEEVLDRIGDLEVGGAVVRSVKGWVDREVLLGLDGRMVRRFGHQQEGGSNGHMPGEEGHEHEHEHDHGNGEKGHQSEVEVLSVGLVELVAVGGKDVAKRKGVNLESLETFLLAAPKDEIYRIKGLVQASEPPASSGGEVEPAIIRQGQVRAGYILNWAFGRWSFTPLKGLERREVKEEEERGKEREQGEGFLLRMTVVLARGEADAWAKRIEAQGYIEAEDEGVEVRLEIQRIL